MKLALNPQDVRALLQEAGEPSTYAIVQDDGELLVRIGNVTLGVPTEEDGKMVFDHDFPAEVIALLRSRGATRKAVVGDTPPEELEDESFAEWRSGLHVAVGDVLRYDRVTYEVIQAHTTQADWVPPNVPALFRVFRESTEPGGEPEPWQAGVAYGVGELVTHEGSTYGCLQAHTSQTGWEPPNVPALWQVV